MAAFTARSEENRWHSKWSEIPSPPDPSDLAPPPPVPLDCSRMTWQPPRTNKIPRTITRDDGSIYDGMLFACPDCGEVSRIGGLDWLWIAAGLSPVSCGGCGRNWKLNELMESPK